MTRIFTSGPDTRLPRFKDRAVFVRRRGQLYMQKAPVKRGKPKSSVTREQNDKFREAILAIHYMPMGQVRAAQELTHGSQFLWRDYLMQCLYGRGPAFFMRTGEVFYPVSSRNDLSAVLDAMSRVPGTMFFRNLNYWEPIPPGVPGQILRFNTLPAAPAWGNPNPSSPPLATQLSRTSNQAANTTSPKTITWQFAAYDDLATWNPATPTRIIIPPGTTRFRVTAQINITQNSAANAFAICLAQPGGAVRWAGAPILNVRAAAAASFTTNEYQFNSGWLAWDGTPYYELVIYVQSAYSWAPLADCRLTLEAA